MSYLHIHPCYQFIIRGTNLTIFIKCKITMLLKRLHHIILMKYLFETWKFIPQMKQKQFFTFF